MVAVETAPGKVRIGVFAGNTLIDATQFAALNSGALQRAGEQHGFEVEKVVAGNGQELVAGLLGGSIDFAVLPSPASLSVNSQRREVALRAVLNTFEGGVLVFVGAKKFESERGQDLRKYDGGTWGYSKEGQQSQTLAQYRRGQDRHRLEEPEGRRPRRRDARTCRPCEPVEPTSSSPMPSAPRSQWIVARGTSSTTPTARTSSSTCPAPAMVSPRRRPSPRSTPRR